jgi:Ca-activated chloride channel homolog
MFNIKIIHLYSGEFIRHMARVANKFATTIRQNTEGVALYTLLITLFFSINNTKAQSAHKYLRQGDGAYKIKDYKKAEGHYRDAQAAERSYKGSYNLGNSVYMQQRYDDALEMYEGVATRVADSDLKAKAHYNQGNAHMYKQDFQKAVDAYKNSLRNNPNDIDAKKNLAFAKKMLEKQQQQQKNQQKNQNKQQQQQNQNQDNKDNQQQQNQGNPPQNQQNQDKQNNNSPPQNQNQDKQNQQQQNPQPNKVNKDNLERQLQIMDEEDRKVQQRLKKGKGKPTASSKDW